MGGQFGAVPKRKKRNNGRKKKGNGLLSKLEDDRPEK